MFIYLDIAYDTILLKPNVHTKKNNLDIFFTVQFAVWIALLINCENNKMRCYNILQITVVLIAGF